MTDNFILSIDPGLSSGLALIAYNEERVWLEGAWQFGDGVAGLISWIKDNWCEYYWDFEWMSEHASGLKHPGSRYRVLADVEITDTRYDPDTDDDIEVVLEKKVLTVIAEKFTARNTQGFSYRTDALEPLRCEGALIALGLMPDYTVAEKRWRDPAVQYLVGGTGKADKKKRQHKFLKDSGFYRTGKDLGTPDADDFRSAAAHGIAYLAKELKHEPTFELLTEWVEKTQ